MGVARPSSKPASEHWRLGIQPNGRDRAPSASFAHEVSQPLVAVALGAKRAEHLLRADLPQTGKLQEVVADIRHANTLAMNVIKNLGDLLKRKSDVQGCDLGAVIVDAVQLLSPEASKRNIDLRVSGIQRALLCVPIQSTWSR